ncbi:MFS transporter [Streptomyces sp. NPDC085481]|uniref:MFS transporter n=1 Tax=Streptomyces sp. NPDC085481 TaxID=3365727 RepID=UPI0037D93CC3
MMYFTQAANHRVQLGSDPEYRGRVMALYTVIFQGTTPLGALLTGWAAGAWGVRWALYAGGLISVLGALAAFTSCPRSALTRPANWWPSRPRSSSRRSGSSPNRSRGPRTAAPAQGG